MLITVLILIYYSLFVLVSCGSLNSPLRFHRILSLHYWQSFLTLSFFFFLLFRHKWMIANTKPTNRKIESTIDVDMILSILTSFLDQYQAKFQTTNRDAKNVFTAAMLQANSKWKQYLIKNSKLFANRHCLWFSLRLYFWDLAILICTEYINEYLL